MRFGLWFVAALVSGMAPCLAAPPALTFDFERSDALGDWHGSPQGAIGLESTSAKSGASSLRLVNDQSSGQPYVTFSHAIDPPSGQFIELRAFIRGESISGYGGLWLRQDGRGKPLLLDNMQGHGVSGTSDWQLLRIRQALVPGTDRIVFGGLLSGTGRMWFDDLELIVDGAAEESDASVDIASPIPHLSAAQAGRVSVLVQVWGFLKFHHAAANTGRVNWDGELIRMLPRVAGATSRSDALSTIGQWVTELGMSACETCTTPAPSSDTQALTPPIDWIRDEERLGPALSALLIDVEQVRAWTGGQHFVALAPNVGNLVSTNEVRYAEASLPAASLRVLAVARIWSAINWWFPYRELAQQPWDSVLPAIVADAVAADSEEAYHRALWRLLAKVNDGHAFLLSSADHRPPSGACHVAAVVRMVEAAPTVVSASADSGLKPGDKIVALDGEPVATLMTDWLPYYSGSSPAARLNALLMNLTRGSCEKAAITVARDGIEITAEAPRIGAPIAHDFLSRDLPGPAFRMLAGSLAYLKLSQARSADSASHLEAASRSGGLIVDLRGYPKEFVVFELAGRLVAAATPFAKFSVASLASPGAFFFTKPIELQPREPRFVGKVAVLIDESTMSQAEYTAMALRAAGATLIGSPSAGADGNVSRVDLPGGLQFMFSGIGVFYPDGKATQGVGLIPDILVAPSIKGVASCKDEVLEAAVLHLAGPSVSNEENGSVCRSLDILDKPVALITGTDSW